MATVLLFVLAVVSTALLTRWYTHRRIEEAWWSGSDASLDGKKDKCPFEADTMRSTWWHRSWRAYEDRRASSHHKGVAWVSVRR